MDELLDLVDKNDNRIGTVWKSAAHQNPALTHREIVIYIFNSKGELLLQQRSLNKKINPGRWTISAVGHVRANEDPFEATKREVKEELGIEIDPKFFEKIFVEDLKHTESKFYYIYTAEYNGSSFTIDSNEVNDAKWVILEKIQNYPLDDLSMEFLQKILDNFNNIN